MTPRETFISAIKISLKIILIKTASEVNYFKTIHLGMSLGKYLEFPKLGKDM